MNLRLITIDFWNTLFDSTSGEDRNIFRRNSYLSELEKIGKRINIKDFDNCLKDSWLFFNKIWVNEQKTPSSFEMVKFMNENLGITLSEKAIEKIANDFQESVLIFPPKLMPYCKDALVKLEKKYKLAVVSDTGFSPGKILKTLLNDNEVLHLFSAFSFSDETGSSKPSAQAFSKVLEELNIKPEEALHIGDIERTDIIGAKSLNMKAIRFTGDPNYSKVLNEKKETSADYMASTWEEIISIIDSVSNEEM